VAERLAQGLALGFEFLACLPVLLPGLREFAVGVTGRREPRLAVRDLQADDAPGQSNPFLAVVGDGLGGLIEAALRLADLLGDIAEVDEAIGVKLAPVVEDAHDVRPRRRLNGRRDARLDVVGVDGLDIEFEAQVLFGLLGNVVAQNLVGSWHEVGPAQPVNRRCLSVRRGPPRCQNSGHAARRCCNGTTSGKPQETSPVHVSSPPYGQRSCLCATLGRTAPLHKDARNVAA
jgi:hypothetical protein